MKAVIMAGGLGTRLFPLTQKTPKPLLPIANRPTISWAISGLAKANLTEIVITAGFGAGAIVSYLGDGQQFGVHCQFSIEDPPLGTAGGLKLARCYLDGEREFLVTSGDCVVNVPFAEVVGYHRQHHALATMVLSPVDDCGRYGTVETNDDGRVLAFHEKDPRSAGKPGLVNTGIYMLSADIFGLIPDGQAFDFGRDLFPQLVIQGYPVYAVALDGYWLDMGVPAQYLQANFDLISGRAGLPVPGNEVAPGIYLEEEAVVEPGAHLRAPCLVGRGAVVHAGATVGPLAVVGPGSVLHRQSQVRNAVLLADTVVPVGGRVQFEIVGPGVRLPVPEIAASIAEA